MYAKLSTGFIAFAIVILFAGSLVGLPTTVWVTLAVLAFAASGYCMHLEEQSRSERPGSPPPDQDS